MAGQNGAWYAIGRAIRELLLGLTKATKTGGSPGGAGPATRPKRPPVPSRTGKLKNSDFRNESDFQEGASPGQFGTGATRDLTLAESRVLRPSYAPDADGDPDPGEIVWTWVPYEENDGRGKDRPVLVIARINGESVAGCMLTTKQHNGYVSVGSGGWDGQGRESFLAPERLLRLTAEGMRREGHVLPRDRFDKAVQAVAQEHGFAV